MSVATTLDHQLRPEWATCNILHISVVSYCISLSLVISVVSRCIRYISLYPAISGPDIMKSLVQRRDDAMCTSRRFFSEF